jgi:hypothetical protein
MNPTNECPSCKKLKDEIWRLKRQIMDLENDRMRDRREAADRIQAKAARESLESHWRGTCGNE